MSVAQTSIDAYHQPGASASRQTQRLQVAEYVINQTKAGKPVCRTQIWEYFTRRGDLALSQKSSVARAVNELIEGVFYDGNKYDFQQVAARKYGSNTVEHFCLVVSKPPSNAAQIDLFAAL